MRKENVLKALSELDSKMKKRKFEQSVELIINLSGMDPRKPDQQVDLKVELPYSTGKGEGKALLFAQSKPFIDLVREDFSRVILADEIPKLKKKDIMDILSYDVLLAEGPVMVLIGKYLGQELAPKGKFPKPVQPEPEKVRAELKNMKALVRITNRKGKGVPILQVVVGKESMKPEELAENILRVYSRVEKALPKQKQNIKSVFIKKTMSPVVRIQ